MPYKLLLADDSITIQKVVELVLAEEDFEIKSVGNGEEALNLMASFKPDIVLADIEMPKMNGYQLCERIKQNPTTADVPVILLAGAFEPIDDAVARKVGADDSVIKPFESQELISKLNAALTMRATASAAQPLEEETFAMAEEAIEIGEEPAGALEGEAVEALEEDLWAIEEIGEAGEVAAEAMIEEPGGMEEPFATAEGEPLAVAGEEAFEIAGEELAVPEAESFEAAAEEEFEIAEEEVIAEPAAVTEEVVRPQPVREARPAEVRMPGITAAQVAVPEAVMPSKEEILAACKKAIDEKVSVAIASLDLRDSLMNSLMPSLKDSIERILWEIAPDLIEKMLKEILKGSIASLTTQVEKVIWETVPDLASSMISKEIERIKSEF